VHHDGEPGSVAHALQAVDGWLPRYLSHVNRTRAPTGRCDGSRLQPDRAAIASADATSFFFILRVELRHIIFNFLNLNAGWIHRIDNGHINRPWKAPSWLASPRAIFAYVTPSSWAPAPGVEPDGAVGRPDHRSLDHPGVCYALIQDKAKFPTTCCRPRHDGADLAVKRPACCPI